VVTYAVNISNVQEVAGEMGRIAAMIQTMQEELFTQQTSNLSDWTSQAKDAYTAAQKLWSNKAQEMAGLASVAQGSLGSITDAYANAEYQGLGLWGQ
jgi:WXG100 family type VII secretion target